MNQLDKILSVGEKLIRKNGEKEIVVTIESGRNILVIETYNLTKEKILLIQYNKISPTSWEREIKKTIKPTDVIEYQEAMKTIKNYGGIN
jgi:hypothetical protein